MDYSYIKNNVTAVRATVDLAAKRAHRNAQEIRVVAVTKSVSEDVLPALLAEDVVDVAENRWQVARDKLSHPLADQFHWHFIGSLQLNKVKYIVPRFEWIHAVDREELYQALSSEATRLERTLQVLLQVNVAEEPQKHGFRLDDVTAAAKRLQGLPGISLRGLMTMAPMLGPESNVDVARDVFRTLCRLQGELRHTLSLETFDQLSMGMSDDYPIAIEEGATLVRVGRNLVGKQTTPEGDGL